LWLKGSIKLLLGWKGAGHAYCAGVCMQLKYVCQQKHHKTINMLMNICTVYGTPFVLLKKTSEACFHSVNGAME
jgi:hypothetical protein